MCVTCLHWIPGPLNKVSALRERSFALCPFQSSPHAPVLIVLSDSHHVRVTNNFIRAANCDEMMYEPNQPPVSTMNKGAERPTARLSRNDQVAPRRNLQIGKFEYLSLQSNALIEFFNRGALADCDLVHATPLHLRRTCWYFNQHAQSA